MSEHTLSVIHISDQRILFGFRTPVYEIRQTDAGSGEKAGTLDDAVLDTGSHRHPSEQ